MSRLLIIFFLIINLKISAQISQYHLIMNKHSEYIPVQIHSKKRAVQIKKEVDKKLGYIYTVSIFDYKNQNQEYHRSSYFTFNSISQYTKAWLTDNTLLLTNNCSSQKQHFIVVIDMQSNVREYMRDFNTKYLRKYSMDLYKYSIDIQYSTLSVSTTIGSYTLPSYQWHCHEVNIFDNYVDVTLGSSGKSDASWNYNIASKKGGFMYKNKDIPTKIRSVPVTQLTK